MIGKYLHDVSIRRNVSIYFRKIDGFQHIVMSVFRENILGISYNDTILKFIVIHILCNQLKLKMRLGGGVSRKSPSVTWGVGEGELSLG